MVYEGGDVEIAVFVNGHPTKIIYRMTPAEREAREKANKEWEDKQEAEFEARRQSGKGGFTAADIEKAKIRFGHNLAKKKGGH